MTCWTSAVTGRCRAVRAGRSPGNQVTFASIANDLHRGRWFTAKDPAGQRGPPGARGPARGWSGTGSGWRERSEPVPDKCLRFNRCIVQPDTNIEQRPGRKGRFTPDRGCPSNDLPTRRQPMPCIPAGPAAEPVLTRADPPVAHPCPDDSRPGHEQRAGRGVATRCVGRRRVQGRPERRPGPDRALERAELEPVPGTARPRGRRSAGSTA